MVGSCRGRGKCGFTLVEVLVATVLLATGLVGALGAFSAAIRASGAAHYYTTTAALAESKLTELTATGSVSPGTTQGDFGEDLPEYSWRLQVQETEHTGLFRADLTIFYQQEGRTREFGLTTYLFRPPPLERLAGMQEER